VYSRSGSQRWQPSLNDRQVGTRITCFEACSAFTHVTACTLAESPKATLYTEGFGDFVASATASVATGWSESCRAGISPAEDRRLSRRTVELRLITALRRQIERESRSRPSLDECGL
jgi:hypothetical protein